MYEIDQKLLLLEKESNPIMTSIIGVGQMGSEIVTQISLMAGIIPLFAVDVSQEKVLNAFKDTRFEDMVIFTNVLSEAEKAAEENKVIATTDYKIAIELSKINVVIYIAGLPEMGAKIALECLKNKKIQL